MRHPIARFATLTVLAGTLLAGCTAERPTQSNVLPTAMAGSADVPTAALPTTAPVAATAAPTAQPPATPAAPAATALSVAPPQPANLLPAPLLFIDRSGQIAQLATDGMTLTTLTAEDAQVIEFAVSAADGALVYLAIPPGSQLTHLVTVGADGSGRTELLRGVLRGVTITPDGQSVQVGVVDKPAQGLSGELGPGVWSIPFGGGEATQLQAAVPVMRSGETVTPGVGYQPISWSPNGERLLLRSVADYGPNAPGGDISSTGLAVYEQEAGQARELLPVGRQPHCTQPEWALRGDAIFCANNLYVSNADPALWRLDVQTGAQQALVPGSAGQDAYHVVAGIAEGEGGIYALVGTSTPTQAATEFELRWLSSDGEGDGILREPIQGGYGLIFAPDTSGIVAGSLGAGRAPGVTLRWHPLDGDPPRDLVSAGSTMLRWGDLKGVRPKSVGRGAGKPGFPALLRFVPEA
jgi:hypothetical protein